MGVTLWLGRTQVGTQHCAGTAGRTPRGPLPQQCGLPDQKVGWGQVEWGTEFCNYRLGQGAPS